MSVRADTYHDEKGDQVIAISVKSHNNFHATYDFTVLNLRRFHKYDTFQKIIRRLNNPHDQFSDNEYVLLFEGNEYRSSMCIKDNTVRFFHSNDSTGLDDTNTCTITIPLNEVRNDLIQMLNHLCDITE